VSELHEAWIAFSKHFVFWVNIIKHELYFQDILYFSQLRSARDKTFFIRSIPLEMSGLWIHYRPEIGYMKHVVSHLINQKYISDEFKNKLNLGIACYCSLQNLFLACACGCVCMCVRVFFSLSFFFWQEELHFSNANHFAFSNLDGWKSCRAVGKGGSKKSVW
jgi:hypothetical protein